MMSRDDLELGQFLVLTRQDEWGEDYQVEYLVCVIKDFNVRLVYRNYRKEPSASFADYLTDHGYVERVEHKELLAERDYPSRKNIFYPDKCYWMD